MKANELRIGSWHIWCGVECQMDAETFGSMVYGVLESTPIPLTEEWLLKFGFEVNTPNLRWMHPVLLSEVYKTESGGLTLLQNGTHLTNNPILYVHQLQNLYFALTGEELTIK